MKKNPLLLQLVAATGVSRRAIAHADVLLQGIDPVLFHPCPVPPPGTRVRGLSPGASSNIAKARMWSSKRCRSCSTGMTNILLCDGVGSTSGRTPWSFSRKIAPYHISESGRRHVGKKRNAAPCTRSTISIRRGSVTIVARPELAGLRGRVRPDRHRSVPEPVAKGVPTW